MRRTFEDILKERNIDIDLEYQKLYQLFTNKNIEIQESRNYLGMSIPNLYSLRDIINMYFRIYEFTETCITLDEFDRKHKINFERNPKNIDIDYLVFFCEYLYNFLKPLQDKNLYKSSQFINSNIYPYIQSTIEQIKKVIYFIGYTESKRKSSNGYITIIFVQKDENVIAVATSKYISEDMSYKIFNYLHKSMKGNIEGKREILLSLGRTLEQKRKILKEMNNKFDDYLFYLLNNMNIRHNNIDKDDMKKYKKYLEEMGEKKLEEEYDEIYRMCLLAIMLLEQKDRNIKIEELKKKMGDCK